MKTPKFLHYYLTSVEGAGEFLTSKCLVIPAAYETKLRFSSAIRYRCLLLKDKTKQNVLTDLVADKISHSLVLIALFMSVFSIWNRSTCMTRLKDGWFSVSAAMLWWLLEERGVRQEAAGLSPTGTAHAPTQQWQGTWEVGPVSKSGLSFFCCKNRVCWWLGLRKKEHLRVKQRFLAWGQEIGKAIHRVSDRRPSEELGIMDSVKDTLNVSPVWDFCGMWVAHFLSFLTISGYYPSPGFPPCSSLREICSTYLWS